MREPIPIRRLKPKFKSPFRRHFQMPRYPPGWYAAGKIGEAALRVYLAICDYTTGYGKYADTISMTQLTAATGLHRSSISVAIRQLEQKRFIEVRRQRHKTSVYAPLDPPYSP